MIVSDSESLLTTILDKIQPALNDGQVEAAEALTLSVEHSVTNEDDSELFRLSNHDENRRPMGSIWC